MHVRQIANRRPGRLSCARFAATLLACLWLAIVSGPALAQDGSPPTRWFEIDTLDFDPPPALGHVDRDTPQSMMESFIFAAEGEDWPTAAYMLDLSEVAPEIRERMGPVLAEQLYEVMQRAMWLDWSALPDRPDALAANASSDDPLAGEPRRAIRLSIVDLDDRPVAIRIVRLKPENAEPVWMFSEETVGNVLALHAIYGPSQFEQALPDFLQERAFWTLKRWEVVALPLVLLLGFGAGYLTWQAVRAIKTRQPYRLVSNILDAVQMPLAMMALVGTFSLITAFAFTFSGPVNRLLAPLQSLLFVAAVAMILVRIVDAILDRVVRDNIEELAEAGGSDQRDLYTNISAVRRLAIFIAFVVAIALVLIQSNVASTLGFSLLASAGVLGILIAFAARAVLADIMASLQIAFAKPARIGDALLWQGQWAYLEKINFTYIQLRTWDNRRLMVPVAEFVSNTFENWTKQDPSLTKVVYLVLDHRADVDQIRGAFEAFIAEDEDVIEPDQAQVLVVGQSAAGMEVRFQANAADPSTGWDLECRMREAMLKAASRLEAENGKEPDRPAFLPREREMQIGEFEKAG